MKILGIETSCDETAVAVVEGRKILSNIIASQGAVHAPFGGVVPEIASRHHIENLPAVLETALSKAQTRLSEIDVVAATYTPGLLPALLIGLQFGKALAFALKKPFIGVNHLEGHLNSVFLDDPLTPTLGSAPLAPQVPRALRLASHKGRGSDIDYPFLGFIVSGGHTHLYKVEAFGKYKLLGATRDDAAGEAFDKVAKLLGLGYPGGPRLDKIAQEGDPHAFRFTKPKLGDESLEFSFSGYKTAALLHVQKQNGNLSQNFVADLAASFQHAVTDFLIDRLSAAGRRHRLNNWVVTGGVAANKGLRQKLATFSKEAPCNLFLPPMELCTDNGAMIAYVGGEYGKRKKHSPLSLNAVAYSALAQ